MGMIACEPCISIHALPYDVCRARSRTPFPFSSSSPTQLQGRLVCIACTLELNCVSDLFETVYWLSRWAAELLGGLPFTKLNSSVACLPDIAWSHLSLISLISFPLEFQWEFSEKVSSNNHLDLLMVLLKIKYVQFSSIEAQMSLPLSNTDRWKWCIKTQLLPHFSDDSSFIIVILLGLINIS